MRRIWLLTTAVGVDVRALPGGTMPTLFHSRSHELEFT
jgi:hypothetical protein